MQLHPARAGFEPGWFTSVMGTGILAICLAASPVRLPGMAEAAVVLWALDVALFVVLAALWLLQAVRHPARVAASLAEPARAQLWGAPPIACFALAVGFIQIGPALAPLSVCVAAAQVLWIAGVAGGLFSAFLVPYLMFTHYDLAPDSVAGSWLLPVVPPIVASVPAALLASTWPVALRGDMLALAYALLGLGMSLAAIVVVAFYNRLLHHKVPQGALVSSMWIVVGPLGQSIAGTIALGNASLTIWPQFAGGLALAGVAYGVLAWGFAVYWLAMAIATTLRALRTGLPFTLGWWAFTFPVGVLTSGTIALYARTGASLFANASFGLLVLLAAMWLLVFARTVHGGLRIRVRRVAVGY